MSIEPGIIGFDLFLCDRFNWQGRDSVCRVCRRPIRGTVETISLCIDCAALTGDATANEAQEFIRCLCPHNLAFPTDNSYQLCMFFKEPEKKEQCGGWVRAAIGGPRWCHQCARLVPPPAIRAAIRVMFPMIHKNQCDVMHGWIPPGMVVPFNRRYMGPSAKAVWVRDVAEVQNSLPLGDERLDFIAFNESILGEIRRGKTMPRIYGVYAGLPKLLCD